MDVPLNFTGASILFLPKFFYYYNNPYIHLQLKKKIATLIKKDIAIYDITMPIYATFLLKLYSQYNQ